MQQKFPFIQQVKNHNETKKMTEESIKLIINMHIV